MATNASFAVDYIVYGANLSSPFPGEVLARNYRTAAVWGEELFFISGTATVTVSFQWWIDWKYFPLVEWGRILPLGTGLVMESVTHQRSLNKNCFVLAMGREEKRREVFFIGGIVRRVYD